MMVYILRQRGCRLGLHVSSIVSTCCAQTSCVIADHYQLKKKQSAELGTSLYNLKFLNSFLDKQKYE